MIKLRLALVAGCMSAAVAGAYAAQQTGSPADTDKAGRMAPGTTGGEMGAVQPTPGKAGPSTLPGSKKGSAASSSATTGAGATSSSGAAASSSGGMDEPKKGRRARASKG